MGLADLVFYCVIIVMIVVALYLESKHFVCDSLTCDMYVWNSIKANNKREFYTNIIDGQTSQSVWMRCFFIATFITFAVYWWFRGHLPPVLEFMSLGLIIFTILYFSLVFYQYHFLSPINKDLKSYIYSSCTKEDQRLNQ